MARGHTHRARSAGLLPLLAGITSALALTGAAVYTVHQTGCDPGEYIQHADHVELVGGCVDGAELHEAPSGLHHDQNGADPTGAIRDNEGEHRR